MQRVSLLPIGCTLPWIFGVIDCATDMSILRRPSQNEANRPPQASFNRPRIPPLGGTITVSLVQTFASSRAGGGPLRTPIHRILSDLQRSSKVSGAQPSDDVETFRLEVQWEPASGALGVQIPPELMLIETQSLSVVRFLPFISTV